MDKTPVSLLQRLTRRADDADWDRFVKLYTPLIYYWGRRSGLQAEDASDLVQDVLTTLVRKLPEFHYDGGKSFRGWLRTVTLNHWRDRRKRRATRSIGNGEVGLSGVAVADDVELFTEEEYRQHVVGQALRLMREEFQETTWKACWPLQVALSPDRKRLAVAVFPGEDLVPGLPRGDRVDIWDLSEGKLVRRPQGIELRQCYATIVALTFTPDSRYLITGSLNGAVRKWDVAGAGPFMDPAGRVVDVPEARLAVPREAEPSRLPDGSYQVMSRGVLKEVTGPFREEESYWSYRPEAFLLSPDMRFLVLHNFRGPRLWDLGQVVPREVSIRGDPRFVLGFRDDKTLVCGNWPPGTVGRPQYWTITDGAAKPMKDTLGPETGDVLLSADGETWAGSAERQQHGALLVGDLTDKGPQLRFKSEKHRVESSNFPLRLFTLDGKRLVLARHELGKTSIQVLDVSGERPRELRSFEIEPLHCAALHPDGVRLAFGTAKVGVKIWNLDTGEREAVVFHDGGRTPRVRRFLAGRLALAHDRGEWLPGPVGCGVWPQTTELATPVAGATRQVRRGRPAYPHAQRRRHRLRDTLVG